MDNVYFALNFMVYLGNVGKDKHDLSTQHLYLEASVADETLKKVVLHSLATAFASIVLPVPGGPKRSTPCNTHSQSLRTSP